MKCQNKIINSGDLVYWYDPWLNNAGVGIVICFKSHWIEILTDSENVDFVLSADSNVNKVEEFSSIKDFIYQKSAFRYRDE